MPDAPRVLFVDQSGELGGAELSLYDVVRGRRVEGDTVALLSDGPFAERLRRAGVRVELIETRVAVGKGAGFLRQLISTPRVLSATARLAGLARSHDVVYANTQKAAVLGALAAWRTRTPMVWHLRDILDAGHFSDANRRAVIAVTNRVARAVIANSHATADAYRRAGGKAPVSVVYNGIDPAPFEEAAAEPVGAIRAALGVPSDAPLVGLFGRLTPWKGQHVLVEALGRPECRGVHALLVGEALFTAEDRAYAERLRGVAARPQGTGPSPQERVHWLGHRDDVARVMRACDVVAHASIAPEPFGRVIVEGMLAGRPVIATAAGGAAEIVEHERTGLLVAPADAGALAGAIRRLVDDADLARRIAAAGAESARERFRLADRVADVSAVIGAVAGPLRPS